MREIERKLERERERERVREEDIKGRAIRTEGRTRNREDQRGY